jgi:hypothetical protein
MEKKFWLVLYKLELYVTYHNIEHRKVKYSGKLHPCSKILDQFEKLDRDKHSSLFSLATSEEKSLKQFQEVTVL